MITNCKNCGLPIFHGAAGYAGAQCRCGFSAKPNYDHNALADLLKERDQLKSENERLKLRLWDLEHSEVDHVLRERDTLRKQLDEARDLLEAVRTYGPPNGEEDRIDAWLEATKPPTGNR